MRSLLDPDARAAVLARVGQLTPTAPPRWGRLTAPAMVVHVSDHLRIALGELEARPFRNPLWLPPLKQMAIRWMPWPRNAPTIPELARPEPRGWEEDLSSLLELVRRFGEADPEGPWPVNPAFGRLTGHQWSILCYRHLDHHLRQFGV